MAGRPDQPGQVWLYHSLKGIKLGHRQTGPPGQVGLSSLGVGHTLPGLPEQSPETHSNLKFSFLNFFFLILLSFVLLLLFYHSFPKFSPFALLHPLQALPTPSPTPLP